MPMGREIIVLTPIIMTIALAVLGFVIPIIHLILPTTITIRLLALLPVLALVDFAVIVVSMLALVVLMIIDA